MKTLLIACVLLSSRLYAQNPVETFKFTTDYYFLDLKGNVGQHQQIIGTYIRDLSAKRVRWDNITIANSARDSPDHLLPAEKSKAMNGFSYGLGAEDMLKAEFFRDVPS